jgi:hypothetical protein
VRLKQLAIRKAPPPSAAKSSQAISARQQIVRQRQRNRQRLHAQHQPQPARQRDHAGA